MGALRLFPEQNLSYGECSNLEALVVLSDELVIPVLEGLVNDGDDPELLRIAVSMLVYHRELNRGRDQISSIYRKDLLLRQSALFDAVTRMDENSQQEIFNHHYYLMMALNYSAYRAATFQSEWDEIKHIVPEKIM